MKFICKRLSIGLKTFFPFRDGDHIQAARDIQNKRFYSNSSSDIACNADMRVGEILQFCALQAEGQSLMRAAMSQLNLSARTYHRIVKLARTITDLAGE